MRDIRFLFCLAVAGACASLAACSGKAGWVDSKLDDFSGFNDTRQMLNEAFSCSWATDRGTASCVRERGADKLYVDREDELVTMFLGPPVSGQPLNIQLDHDQDNATQVHDFYDQLEAQSPTVASLQFNVANATPERVRDFLVGHFAFNADEVDRVLQDFAAYEQQLASGDGPAALARGGQRPTVTHGHLRLSGAGNGILLQHAPST